MEGDVRQLGAEWRSAPHEVPGVHVGDQDTGDRGASISDQPQRQQGIDYVGAAIVRDVNAKIREDTMKAASEADDTLHASMMNTTTGPASSSLSKRSVNLEKARCSNELHELKAKIGEAQGSLLDEKDGVIQKCHDLFLASARSDAMHSLQKELEVRRRR